MSTIHDNRRFHRLQPLMLRALAAASLLLTAAAGGRADGEVSIIKVEEDWELDVAMPDPEANVPQVVCVFGPSDPNTGRHAVFEINHCTAPSFAPGGMQLQAWDGETRLWYRNHPNTREFDAAVDCIKFTAVTELIGNRLYLDIDYGQSANWGSFGYSGYLRGWLPTNRNHLNDYNPDHSITHSRITYGKHRVNRYVRTEVRYFTAEGLYRTEEDDSVVFMQDPN
jgi:hypothetical protein